MEGLGDAGPVVDPTALDIGGRECLEDVGRLAGKV